MQGNPGKSPEKLAPEGAGMYKKDRFHQFGLSDFNQPFGLKMNPENRWVRKSEMIPWEAIEDRYADLFKSTTGMPAKPLRCALGSLLIQKQLGFSDRELVEEIRENPYLQYFIGLPGYIDSWPFVPSLLVEFRKRLPEEVLAEINEMIIAYNTPDKPDKPDKPNDTSAGQEPKETEKEPPNSGTMILDATCAPQDIAFPQDINLLNEARENLEEMIDSLCYEYNTEKPRTYRNNARKDYLNLARCKKRSSKKIRKAIKQQLQYVRRDLGHVDKFLSAGMELKPKQKERLETIRKVYSQQEQMYRENTHSVPERIVSISQPYIRPIVRGKAAAPVEFGAKFDLSIDERGLGRIERFSFEAYNESDVLIGAAKRYKERNGHYPERILADKIYRNRENLSFCKEHGIRLSGPALGRPKKNAKVDKKTEYRDNADRVEVERAFSLAKRSYGLGCIRTKLADTTGCSIALSIIAMNIARLTGLLLCRFLKSIFSRYRVYKSTFCTRYLLITAA